MMFARPPATRDWGNLGSRMRATNPSRHAAKSPCRVTKRLPRRSKSANRCAKPETEFS